MPPEGASKQIRIEPGFFNHFVLTAVIFIFYVSQHNFSEMFITICWIIISIRITYTMSQCSVMCKECSIPN